MTYDDSLAKQAITNEIWHIFEPSEIPRLVESGKIVVVDISADWCATCKYNKYIAWENPYVKSRLQKKDIVALRGDYTEKDDMISKYLRTSNAVGIPFSKVYGPKNPTGIELPVLLSPSDVIGEIEAVSGPF